MTKHLIDEVIIIYNPNSTGNSVMNAKQLKQDLKDVNYKKKIILRPTKYARHAEKIAENYAKKDMKVLLVSSSGDGGYHELINGILKYQTKHVIAGLLPSGNANDHFSAIGTSDVAHDIATSKVRRVDVLKIESTVKGRPWVRYAHSYVGIGISPVIGRELNEVKLNVFNEKIILVRQLLSYDYVSVMINERKRRLTSLVFANIPKMSKVLKIAKKSKINDGKFEVNSIDVGSKWQIFGRLFQASTLGLEEASSKSSYEFQTIKPLPIQLDGEIYTIDSNSKVTVTCVYDGLAIII